MIPLPCRFMIAVAALAVPRSKRAEWKREWRAELWHKSQAGAELPRLLSCAWGAFRDAAWLLQSERKRRGFDLFRKPLRSELGFLLAAILMAAAAGGLSRPALPYANSARLITVDHPTQFGGARNWMFPSNYVGLLRRKSGTLADLVMYQPVRGSAPGLLVSRNLLSALGAKPLLGRDFSPGDSESAALLSEEFFRTRFHSDARVLGSTVPINQRPYRVVGVMPRDFWFLSDRIRFYAVLDQPLPAVGFVGLLAPGETVQAAEAELRRIAGEVAGPPFAEGLEAQPILTDLRQQELAFAAIAALAGTLLGVAFLLLKRLGGLVCPPRYWLLLGARLSAVLLGFGFLRIWALALSSANRPTPSTAYSLWSVWAFLLLCFAVMCLLIIDHRGRCLSCFARLRMPAPIGVWSSCILDQPVTEYVCPAGHGALIVAGTGNAPDHWTALDQTWQDLFAHTEE